MSKIVISGYYGFDNLGDEAVLQGIITSLRQEAGEGELEIIVLSASPVETEERYGVRASGRFSPLSLLTELFTCDLFISGGGSLLQDTTGWKTVPYYLTLIFIARLLGAKTAVYAQGVGPLAGRLTRFLVGWVLRRVDLITVRDHGSRELLVEVGVPRERIKVTVDAAFALEPFSRDIQKKDVPCVGVAVRPWDDNDYLSGLAEELDSFLAEIEGQCLLLPLQLEEDYSVCSKLRELMERNPDIYGEQLVPAEVADFFTRFDFMIGVRLHSLILSALEGVPFFALSYDPKVESFVKELGLDNWLPLPECRTPLLGDKLMLAWEKKKDISDRLHKIMVSYHSEANRNARRVLQLLGKG
ncbi:MAG: polysaccharide pyruvyl transferase CsaB [Bacillota bacterium]